MEHPIYQVVAFEIIAPYTLRVQFDDETEDFPDFYKVFLVPPFTTQELAGSWVKLHERARKYLGEVRLSDVTFDPSRRKEIETALLDQLTALPAVVQES